MDSRQGMSRRAQGAPPRTAGAAAPPAVWRGDCLGGARGDSAAELCVIETLAVFRPLLSELWSSFGDTAFVRARDIIVIQSFKIELVIEPHFVLHLLLIKNT